MEDELWYMQQQSRVLQEFRREIQGLWDDEAARELNLRFLNPHQNDDQQMLAGLVGQDNALDGAHQRLDAAQGLAVQVEKLSAETNEQLELCRQDVETCYQLYEQYREYHSGAHALFPTIEELINRANASCKGVPTE
jgi:phosphoglycolate phosphatase-like HAD superfamily hydrolase